MKKTALGMKLKYPAISQRVPFLSENIEAQNLIQ